MTVHAINEQSISGRLDQLAQEAPEGGVSLDWIMGQLHERAFGLFLLVLALPCCIPFLYGIPQIVALPLMFVSAQILIGRETPWLPDRLAARTVST
ncbi:MAG: exopolysaccharide biosynthesis protein, partial [Pseudomonadota bacterium]